MIPDEAVEAALGEWARWPRPVELVTRMLEAAAPHLMIHVHHHDMENHARSFNEGYETAMAQELADDPTTAQDWFDDKIRVAMATAWDECLASDTAWINPYRKDSNGQG